MITETNKLAENNPVEGWELVIASDPMVHGGDFYQVVVRRWGRETVTHIYVASNRGYHWGNYFFGDDQFIKALQDFDKRCHEYLTKCIGYRCGCALLVDEERKSQAVK